MHSVCTPTLAKKFQPILNFSRPRESTQQEMVIATQIYYSVFLYPAFLIHIARPKLVLNAIILICKVSLYCVETRREPEVCGIVCAPKLKA